MHANISTNNTGVTHKIPVILIEGQGLLVDHAQYLLLNINKGKTWRTNSIQSVRMFMDFIAATQSSYESPSEAFKGFVDACRYGTKDMQGNDPSGLYWNPLSNKRGNVLIKHLTMYTDYLANTKDNEKLRLNPFKKATRYEEIVELAAYYHRNKNTFLSHLNDGREDRGKAELARVVAMRTQRGATSEYIKNFPEEHVSALVLEGFKKKGVLPTSSIYKRVDLGNVLITYLLVYGGLRVSEPFHIYLDDVLKDEDGCAIVKVYHPEEGFAPCVDANRKPETRASFLAKKFGLLPRNNDANPKNYYAGWKDPALHVGNFFYVNWFPRSAGIEFYKLFKVYIENVRIRQTTEINSKGAMVLKENANHPFVFVNRDGAPKSYHKYVEQFKRAVERIGLTSRKDLGTTPHGCRHYYGQSLKNSGVDGQIITRALHHRSPDSKDVYTEANEKTVKNALIAGSTKMIRNFADE